MSNPATPPSPVALEPTCSAPEGCTEPALGKLFARYAGNLAEIEDCELRERVLRHASRECDACWARSLELLAARIPPALAPNEGAK